MLDIIRSVPLPRLIHYLRIRWRYLTFRKTFNIIKIEIQRMLKVSRVNGYPYELTLGITNTCQLRCPLCATGLHELKRSSQHMSYEVLDRALNQLGPYALSTYLHWFGEPFLHPEVIDFARKLHENGIGTVISSNLSFEMDDDMAEGIIRSGLDLFIASIDGTTEDVYVKYRRGGKLHLAMDNLKKLISKKKELESSSPFIEWQFLVTRHNEHQVADAQKTAQRLGVDSFVTEQAIFLKDSKSQEEADEWFPSSSKYRIKHGFDMADRSDNLSRGKCWWPWRAVVIDSTGNVSPCCYNKDENEDFGNIMRYNRKLWMKKYERILSVA